MNVRLATEHDLGHLVAVYMTRVLSNRREAERFARLHFGFDRCLLAEQEGVVLGFLFWGPRLDPRLGLAEITGVIVNERVRRKGVATLLVLLALEDMQAYFSTRGGGFYRAFAHATQEDLSTRRLLEKIGFTSASQIKDHTKPGETTVIYALSREGDHPAPRPRPPRVGEKPCARRG